MLDNFYQGEGSLGGSVASKVFPKIPTVARSFKEAVRELRHCVGVAVITLHSLECSRAERTTCVRLGSMVVTCK